METQTHEIEEAHVRVGGGGGAGPEGQGPAALFPDGTLRQRDPKRPGGGIQKVGLGPSHWSVGFLAPAKSSSCRAMGEARGHRLRGPCRPNRDP